MAEEDLIFGKNMHLFGGIEPSNVKHISAEAFEHKMQLSVTLPDDTVIDDQVLCTVEGAVIRRRSDKYPINEFDGERVADIKNSTVFTDDTSRVDGTYYYQVFPYSTQGVYNRNHANRMVYNEPRPLDVFTSALSYDADDQRNYVQITLEIPEGISGVYIRRSDIDFPETEDDGELIRTSKLDETFTDLTADPGHTYYYSAFPYTSTGNINYSTSNRTAISVVLTSPPDPMKSFSAVCTKVGTIRLTATLPDSKPDANVSGAIIRRKTGSYPTNESDGTLVTDLKSSGTFDDNTVDTGNRITYYYRAFPYTTIGVYNRQDVTGNKATAQSIPYSAPDNMQSFQVKVYPGPKAILVEWTLPENTYEGSVLTSQVAGVTICRKTGGYPVSETDYDVKWDKDATQSGSMIDSNLSPGVTYYYSAFPKSNQGLYNRSGSIANRGTAIPRAYTYLYGFDINEADSNPATRVSYPADVDNANWAPVTQSTTTTNGLNLGGWSDYRNNSLFPKPCMLSSAGTVTEYLDYDDYTKTVTGAASSVADVSYDGNAMLEWGLIYTKRWTENGVYHFRACDIKLDSSYECWCNYNASNMVKDHFYMSIFVGLRYNSTGNMKSLSGLNAKNGAPSSASVSGFWSMVTSNGAGWYPFVYGYFLFLWDLWIMICKHTNPLSVFGPGRKNYYNMESNDQRLTGIANKEGYFCSSDENNAMKVFGMEDFIGFIGILLAGYAISYRSSQLKTFIKATIGTKDGTTSQSSILGNSTGWLEYEMETSRENPYGYVKGCTVEPFGRIPTDLTGTSTTFDSLLIDGQVDTDRGPHTVSIDYSTAQALRVRLFGSGTMPNTSPVSMTGYETTRLVYISPN